MLKASGLSKSFGSFQVLHDIDLVVGRGERVVICGPSGSGKSTLIRHIAGLVASDRESCCKIQVFGKTVQSGGRIDGEARTASSRNRWTSSRTG